MTHGIMVTATMKYKFWFWWSFFAIILLAFCLRFYRLGSIPSGLYWDEVAMLVDAKSIAQSGHDMHGRPWFQVIYPSYGDYKLPVYIWLASISVYFLGVSNFAVRLPSMVAGMGSVVVAGLLVRELVNQFLDNKSSKATHSHFFKFSFAEIAQLFTMLVMAVSPWSVLFSRTAFEGHVGQLLLGLSILLMLYAQKKPWLLILSTLLGGAATYTYFSVRFVWVAVFVFASLIIYWAPIAKLGKTTRLLLMRLMLPLIFFGVLLLPMMRSPLYADSNRFRLSTDSILKSDKEVLLSNVYRELAGNTIIDRIFFHRWWLIFRNLLSNYSDNLSLNFLFISGDPNLRHGTGENGLFFFTFLPFLFYGLYLAFSRHKGIFIWLVLWWLVALLPASVPNTTPHALRSLNALIPVSIFIGLGMAQFWLKFFGWVKKSFKLNHHAMIFSQGLVLAAIVAIPLLRFSHFYFTQYPIISAPEWQGGFQDLAETMVRMRTNHQPTYVFNFDDKFYLWLMAYGPYTAKDFHSWQSQGFLFRQFDGITFSPLVSLSQGQEVILVGKPEQLNEFMAKNKAQVNSIGKVTGYQEKVLFEVIDITGLK
jgi:4-amino-4-deoxy-L-arabinose transferase-like glycosyltransferase